MLSKLTALFFLICMPALAYAQQGPLSPPAKPPVPLSDSDQERARQEELAKRKKAGESVTDGKIKIPAVAVHGQHISTGKLALDGVIRDAAALYRLDPCLIVSVMRAESGFNTGAVSPKGASGLMQLMPATAARFGVRNIFDTRENIMGGARYLRWLLDRFGGDVRLALAGYNAGEGAVEFYKHRIPPFLETQNYVRTIYARYSKIHADPGSSIGEAVDVAERVAPAVGEKIPTYNQIIRFTSTAAVVSAPGQ